MKTSCVLSRHWTTISVRIFLWSHTFCTLMVWYPFLRTYVSSLPGGGFIAIKVPPTHLKLLGVSSSEEKPCSTSNCAAGVVGNLMQLFWSFLNYPGWLNPAISLMTVIAQSKFSFIVMLKMNKIILNNWENWIMLKTRFNIHITLNVLITADYCLTSGIPVSKV